MEINSTILEIMKKNNNMITTAQVIELGFSCALLLWYVKEGLLERGRKGFYIFSDSIHDDMYALMLRSDKIIFSHDTALFLNGLSEKTLFTHSVTIPSNSKLSNDWDNKKFKLKRNREYWIEKIEENMERDSRVDKELMALGWRPLHFWSKEVKKDLDSCIDVIKETIFDYILENDD